MWFRLRGKKYEGQSLKELSEKYCQLRDDSGEGASTFPFPPVYSDKTQIGHISYNGRVWDNEDNLIYENGRF
jgi:hypothetical protein